VGLLGVCVLCYLPVGWAARVLPEPVWHPLFVMGSLRDARHAVPVDLRPFIALRLVWAAGAAVVMLRVWWAWISMGSLTGPMDEVRDPAWRRALEVARADSGVRQPVRLRTSDAVATPLVWGILRPVIVLPPQAATWSAQERRAVLLHELAHVRRHDCAVWMVAQVAVALFWFHPGVWWAAARLLAARELACDERVVRAGVQRADYAECLMRVADRARAHGAWSSVAVAAGMARPSRLKDRLHAVLTAAPRSRALDRAASLAVAVCAAATVALLGSARLAPTPAAVALAIRSPDPSVQAYARFYAMRYRCMDAPETCRKRTSTATVKQ
jgi:beta-lactamase regulating signal transducer with metallopeptidase domain